MKIPALVSSNHCGRRFFEALALKLNIRFLTAILPPVVMLACLKPNAANAECAPVLSGLVAWWRGEDNATDSAGASHDGTLQNGATFADGKVGQAFSFDGEDDSIVVPHNADLNGGSGITIEAWVHPRSLGHGRPILQKRSSSNVGGYTFETGHSPYAPDNSLGWVIWISGTQHYIYTDANALKTATWQHVAATYDGKAMRVYVNGVEQASLEISGEIQAIDDVDDPVVLGRNVVIPSFAWDGSLDEVTIYNRALSQGEIQAIFDAGEDGKCFVARWSENGHFYEFVRASDVTWSNAKSAAALRAHVDPVSGTSLPGHLATITSAGENAFILEKFGLLGAGQFAWVAGHEPVGDGEWRWGAGPEAGNIFDYVNWGLDQPDVSAADENFLKVNIGGTFGGIDSGQWASALAGPDEDNPVAGYLVEYSRSYECPLTPKAPISEVESGWLSEIGATYTVQYAPDLSFSTGVITSGPHDGTGFFMTEQIAIPAFSSSVKFFRVIVSGGSAGPRLSIRPSKLELHWPSLPGKEYQVQSFDNTAGTWSDEGASITATGWTTTARFDIVAGAPWKSYQVNCP